MQFALGIRSRDSLNGIQGFISFQCHLSGWLQWVTTGNSSSIRPSGRLPSEADVSLSS